MAARELPGGTVTLLFTDIEGSTRMLQELGRDAYVRALTDHRRLLREAFAARGGVEVEMKGDSFFFVFPGARDAVEAAAAGQRALAEYHWESEPIRVRIGLHTGEPTQADGLYAGLDVHHAARVMSAGHGGQIVVSHRTAELVAGELPHGITLLDLGEHRLKDLTEPERLHQVAVAGMPSAFPPLASLPSSAANLPSQAAPLVGRRQELEELRVLLLDTSSRLVTVTGVGGTGKTRLALAAAAELSGRFEDGVHWVPLAPLTSSDLVAGALVRALGLRDVPDEPLETTLLTFLGTRKLLLLLDNFEHVLGARVLLAELLASCPELRLLVTSRVVLSVSGEHVYEAPPLREDEAVQLFVDRASRAGANVEADAAVVGICLRVDCLPLAIELAAARVRLLEPAQLLERLDRRLPLLTGGAVDRPLRQQTLYQTIAWSHDLLDEREQVLFRRLSVFAGSFTVDGAEAVAAADLATLESLIAQSLVRRWGSGRLGLLETIREFALECLAEAGERGAIEAAHALHFLALAETVEPFLSVGPKRVPSVNRLAQELDNLHTALTTLGQSGRGEELLRLATAIWRFWMARGDFTTGRAWLEQALLTAGGAPVELRARALEALGAMHALSGDLDRSDPKTAEALELFRALADSRGVAETLNNLGLTAFFRGDHRRAASWLEESVAVAQTSGNTYLIAVATQNLGSLAVDLGDVRKGSELLDRAAHIYEQLGDTGQAAVTPLPLGFLLVDGARSEAAAQVFARCLSAVDELPQREQAALALAGVAVMLSRRDEHEAAALLFGAADALIDAIGTSWDGAAGQYARVTRERACAATREHLAPAAFGAAYAAGRRLQVEEAISRATEHASRIAAGTRG